jgi:hypothetical protein
VEVAGLPERIRQIVASSGKSARAFCEACGLNPNVLSTLLPRLDKDPFAVELKTLAAIAQGGGVSLRWLLFGEEDAAKHRNVGAELARSAGISAAAISAVLAAPVLPDERDKSAGWWARRMADKAIEMVSTPANQTAPPPVPRPTSLDDTSPPRTLPVQSGVRPRADSEEPTALQKKRTR